MSEASSAGERSTQILLPSPPKPSARQWTLPSTYNANAQSGSRLLSLPAELGHHILSYVPPSSVLKLALAGRKAADLVYGLSPTVTDKWRRQDYRSDDPDAKTCLIRSGKIDAELKSSGDDTMGPCQVYHYTFRPPQPCGCGKTTGCDDCAKDETGEAWVNEGQLSAELPIIREDWMLSAPKLHTLIVTIAHHRDTVLPHTGEPSLEFGLKALTTITDALHQSASTEQQGILPLLIIESDGHALTDFGPTLAPVCEARVIIENGGFYLVPRVDTMVHVERPGGKLQDTSSIPMEPTLLPLMVTFGRGVKTLVTVFDTLGHPTFPYDQSDTDVDPSQHFDSLVRGTARNTCMANDCRIRHIMLGAGKFDRKAFDLDPSWSDDEVAAHFEERVLAEMSQLHPSRRSELSVIAAGLEGRMPWHTDEEWSQIESRRAARENTHCD
ncbi:uncharacterized protein MKK02DRAFT_29131 [Dioszegia hungarica]|uniref:F-box domain-containing protein n=1 Tax=Dioszegia hungarica TaxID=4972 RepID=A0AA38H3K5_9TREE|nr:uncharacterized protein MKK02DRAFT_29131 [Dioszegia hungarica]KAI9633261.1 hypothetical protein MKK02DRAFT_29131 [Dioszegia hungarica]